MKEWQYKVTFLTPAFLGDAQQNGRWRTPPFKALIRQWWRVVWAADHGFPSSYDQMRVEEGLLFGNAWLKDGTRETTKFAKSLVRIRLDKWSSGKLLKKELRQSAVELQSKPAKKKRTAASILYLAYGPLTVEKGKAFRDECALDAGEEAVLTIRLLRAPSIEKFASLPPEDQSRLRLERALELIHLFGALGGRSRNGWGSVEVAPDQPWGGTSVPLRPWEQALKLDWPHAVGEDEKGPLVWRTARSYTKWHEAMQDLALIRLGLRASFSLSRTHPQQIPDRLWLAYPVTNNVVPQWGTNSRLPNSLRFKVQRDPGKRDALIGVIYHMPCAPPRSFDPDLEQIQRIWRKVHSILDALSPKTKQKEAASFSEELRQIQLKRLDPFATFRR